MYSRYTSAQRENNYRIPEHYSGCAFAAPNKEEIRKEQEPLRPVSLPKTKISPSYAEAATPSAAPPQQACPMPPAEPAPSSEEHGQPSAKQNRAGAKKEPPIPEVFGQLLSHIGAGLPFSNGIDFDSLLLLGLILLLAGDGGDTELLLLLTLLLFCT